MQKSRFREAQIIGVIKEQEAGMPTAEVCRKHGLSQGTFTITSPNLAAWRCPTSRS
jgi:putative transposase